MFGSLDVSTSALIAQRTRLESIAGNLANMHSVYDANGNVNPYRRRIVVFAPGDPATGDSRGVHVEKIMLDASPFRKVYEPGNPADVDGDGYVEYPNVNPATEMVNALEASRAYEANVTAAQATKQMIRAGLQLLA